MILDDFDSRPGSATSLLRTIIGACLRDLGGEITIGGIIRLMEGVGVAESQARTAVSRVKRKGLLLPGYSLNPDALPMLESGDRRIFTSRQMGDGDAWCLISFSIPENLRSERHQLRRRLSWIGCGTVATGLWISPAFLADEVEQILGDLGLSGFATLFTAAALFTATAPRFTAGAPQPFGSLADATASWWDLARLGAMHRRFLAATDPLLALEPTGATAFSAWIHTLDEWRVIPYLDPGLPPGALPANWPGVASLARFRLLIDRFAGGGLAFASSSAELAVSPRR